MSNTSNCLVSLSLNLANQKFECYFKLCYTLIFITEGIHIRKYKRYLDNPSVPVPKSTKCDRNKRSATRSNAAISIPQSVVDFVAVLPTESSASQTFVEEPEATICDYRDALDFSERRVENEDTRFIETLSRGSDSECSEISSSQDSSLVTSESDESDLEAQCYTSDEDEQVENDNVDVETRLLTDHEKACQAVLAYVSRHCMKNEAAKDLIDLVKVTCPESLTFKSLSYSKVQEVCGQCELHVTTIGRSYDR